jgi:hypothetical protein
MLRASARGYARSVLGVGLLCTSLSVEAQPAKPANPNLEQAKVHMAAGTSFYNEPPVGSKCEAAVVEFEKAFQLSGSWRALRALAICELYLERDGAARDHFEQVLSIGGNDIPADEKKQVSDDLARLKASIATLKVSINAPTGRLITTRQASDGKITTNRYPLAPSTTIGIHPGVYTFTAQTDGFPDVTWSAEVGNGATAEKLVEFKAAPAVDPGPGPRPGPGPAPKQFERPIPVTVWIFTGVAGAAAIGTGVFMGLAASAKSDFDAQNGVADATTLEDLRSDVITKNIVADVLLGTTIAAAGATLIFYFTRPEVEVSSTETAWSIAPMPLFSPDGASPVGAAAFIGGTFR